METYLSSAYSFSYVLYFDNIRSTSANAFGFTFRCCYIQLRSILGPLSPLWLYIFFLCYALFSTPTMFYWASLVSFFIILFSFQFYLNFFLFNCLVTTICKTILVSLKLFRSLSNILLTFSCYAWAYCGSIIFCTFLDFLYWSWNALNFGQAAVTSNI